MRIDLPSGAWIEVREALTTDDKWAVQGAVPVVVEDGQTILPGNLGEKQMKAFLERIITDWSFKDTEPVPAMNALGGEAVGKMITDLDDWNALEDQVMPLYEKVIAPNRRRLRGSRSS